MSNAQIAYEYVQKSYDTLLQTRVQILERVHKLLLCTVILFTALSYGMAQLLPIADATPAWLTWSSKVLGALAGLLLGAAFFCALRLLRIDSVSVPGTAKLAQHIQNPELLKFDEGEVWAALGKCVTLACDGEIKHHTRTRRWHLGLNTFLMGGYLGSVLFVSCVMFLRIGYVTRSGQPSEDSAINGKVSQMTEAEPNQPVVAPPSTQPATSPTPPTSGPSEEPGSQPAASLSPSDLVDTPHIVAFSQKPAMTKAKPSVQPPPKE